MIHQEQGMWEKIKRITLIILVSLGVLFIILMLLPDTEEVRERMKDEFSNWHLERHRQSQLIRSKPLQKRFRQHQPAVLSSSTYHLRRSHRTPLVSGPPLLTTVRLLRIYSPISISPSSMCGEHSAIHVWKKWTNMPHFTVNSPIM